MEPLVSANATASAALRQHCAAHGIRLTGPRRHVLAALAESRDHPDIDLLWERVRALDPSVSLATVYRFLGLLEAKRIVRRHEFGGRRGRFEVIGNGPHDHLIDVATGRIIEFRDGDLDALQQAVAKRLGYRLLGHKLELYAASITADAAE
jgi:Fur family ferric uptake transcriptional regulator